MSSSPSPSHVEADIDFQKASNNEKHGAVCWNVRTLELRPGEEIIYIPDYVEFFSNENSAFTLRSRDRVLEWRSHPDVPVSAPNPLKIPYNRGRLDISMTASVDEFSKLTDATSAATKQRLTGIMEAMRIEFRAWSDRIDEGFDRMGRRAAAELVIFNNIPP